MVAASIAIVDDEPELCSLFAMLVRNLGYRIEFVAHDGNEIVKAISDGSIHPDLMLMDYRMPLMNGLQASEKILLVRPETRIVIVTADDSVRRDVVSAGLLFVQKPFSVATLARTIEDALNSSKKP